MNTLESPFYPPRAGWFGRRLTTIIQLRRHWSPWTLTPMPGTRSWTQFALWLLIPGLCFIQRKKVKLGWSLLTAWLLMAVLNLALIGTPGATWAYVGLTTTHSLSASFALTTAFAHRSLQSRLRRASLWSFVLILCLYVFFPIQNRFVRVFEVRNKAILINTAQPNPNVANGQWVAYNTLNHQIGFDRVIARAGQTIRFNPDSFEVDGQVFARLGAMPQAGRIEIPAGHYYIWPTNFSTLYHGDLLPPLLERISIVASGDIIGPAYRRWFWRVQELPPLEPYVAARETPDGMPSSNLP